MVENFPLLQQKLGSYSCLPTCITAILQYFNLMVTVEEVSGWCNEDSDGCVIDVAMQGLRDQDCDIIKLTNDPENEIRQYVNDPNDPMPILVTIMPAFSSDMDHAVVVLGLKSVENKDEIVTLMDPLCGCIRIMDADLFFLQWDNAGQIAYLITA